jgi:hypothetical protein
MQTSGSLWNGKEKHMDSGGDAGLGGSRGRARTKLRRYVALGAGGDGKARPKQEGRGGTLTLGPIQPLIIAALDDAGVTEDVFTAPELIYYLEQMARFIQESAHGEKVSEVFGVRDDSVFAALQRKIRLAAPGNTASGDQGSDSHKRALDAFQSGSSKWARERTKAKDVLRITVKVLSTAVRQDVDAALLSSPRAILHDYVDHVVVGSFLGGDPVLKSLHDQTRREYQAKMDAFFARFDKPGHWVATRIEKTMESFPQALR